MLWFGLLQGAVRELGKQDFENGVEAPLFLAVVAEWKPTRMFSASKYLHDETLPLDRSHNATLPDEPVRAEHMETLDDAQVLPHQEQTCSQSQRRRANVPAAKTTLAFGRALSLLLASWKCAVSTAHSSRHIIIMYSCPAVLRYSGGRRRETTFSPPAFAPSIFARL